MLPEALTGSLTIDSAVIEFNRRLALPDIRLQASGSCPESEEFWNAVPNSLGHYGGWL